MTTPWLSAITVVKDDPAGFDATLHSLLAQDRDGVEFVVIDSSDDRAAIPDHLVDVGCTYEWVPAQGIYSAMNSALSAATGDFVYFANAGDTFFSPTVLAQVRPLLEGREWGFGAVEIIEADGRHVFTPHWDYARERDTGFSRGLFPAHQGTFARRDRLRGLGGFDTDYTIAADYAMALRLALAADPVLLPFVIATFREGGASTRGWQESFREFHRARREIWQPRGLAALREQVNTSRHFGMVWANRELLPRLRGGAR